MGERWTMNRIGFVNFWLYDVDEFSFENGKLLLRGQNGSGKSITTQSFIPFILDGDRTPSRLDPFGSGDRRMEYYFLGEEGKEESTGYLYLEFWKKESGEYRTIGIGQRARKGKPMDFWGFVILDGRRVGYDIWLYKEVGSSRIPLDKGELRKALGEEVPFTDVPREYKELVNKYLFGFSRAEQYEQFIKLLVKVRAPKLSKEFRPTKVYEILNDSLQTLTDEDLRPMVDAMEKMDSIQGNLDQLNRALSDVKIIRNEYMRYNRYMLGKKGQAYLAAKAAVAQAQAEVDRQEMDRSALQREQREKSEAHGAWKDRVRMAAAELESLLDTDLEEIDAKLDKARSDKEEEQEREERIKERIRQSRENILGYDGNIRRLQGQREEQLSRLEEEKEELARIQETLCWEMHDRVLALVEERDVYGSGRVAGELQKYQRAVLAGKDSVESYAQIQRQMDEVSQEAEARKRDREEKKAQQERALQELELAREECIRHFFEANSVNLEWKLSPEELHTVEQMLQEYQGMGDGRRIDQRLQQIYQQRKDSLKNMLLQKEKELEEYGKALEELEQRRAAVQAREELEPERGEAVEASRRMLEAAGVPALPFYKTVEFASDMTPEECARLEWQLHAAGLLDALVVTAEDFGRLKADFPGLVDCVIRPQKRGGSDFPGLVVNRELEPAMQEAVRNILSNISQSQEGKDSQVFLEKEGYFGQGILFGKAGRKEEAEYVGVLARRQKKERLLRQLGEEMEQLQALLGELGLEKEHINSRIGRLDEEYRESLTTDGLDAMLDSVKEAGMAWEQADRNYRVLEERLEVYGRKVKESYQKMLSACKPFPYGRTVEEYAAAVDAAADYLGCWQGIYGLLMQVERGEADIRMQQSLIEKEEDIIDNGETDRRNAAGKIKELDFKIRQYEEYLDQPEIREKAQRRETLKKEQKELEEQIRITGERLAVIEDNLRRIAQDEEKLRSSLIEKIAREDLLRKYFEEELGLKLVFDREARGLEDCAREAVQSMREGDEGRDVSTLTTALHQVYSSYNSNLVSYGTSLEECFEEAQAGSEALRKRLRIASLWNGKKLYLEEFFRMLKSAIEETALLIQQKDRELFEDILSKTISQQLTDRIAESRKWVQDMSSLMKIDTSMGLYFSLDWKPRTAENEQELDTKELEKILLRDYELLSNDDIAKVAAHFRSKIKTEKQRAEETGEAINYMDLVRDALDYRKWFEFQMFFYRNNEGRKNLTNSAFNKFSGGEKAMAMYIPLFAAVNAQYRKAQNKDHPRIIALDEAFAGVDDKNISSMFKLVEDMDFDYIMNSQALWGCFETVPALHISELRRPLNSQVVTLIHYTWNGHERILDEQ